MSETQKMQISVLEALQQLLEQYDELVDDHVDGAAMRLSKRTAADYARAAIAKATQP